MVNFRRLLIAVVIAASVFYVAGCSSDQATNNGQGAVQSEYDQSAPSSSQGQPQQTQASGYKDVDAAQAKKLIDSDKTVQIIDVREDYEYAEGHIPGAKLIPVNQLISRIGEIDKTKPVLVYCATSSRSPVAAQVLAESGYTKVYNLSSGIAQWPYNIEK
ncbi:MAG TPA: rhodanese-like domain-containing protein [Anaerolineae bacterium]|nr:rhodanese-like domain-containing protein [Anaerolineae bacterium]